MLPEYFNLIAPVITLSASYLYIKSILKGDTVPNKVGWFIWALAPIVSSFIILKNGGGWSAIPVFMSWIIPAIVLIVSFKIKTKFKITKLDIVCLISALIAMYLWLKEDNLFYATIFAILADGFGFVPIIVKSWKYPKTEKPWPFLSGIVSASISLLTLNIYDFHLVAFPLYLILGNTVLVLVMLKNDIFKFNKKYKNIFKLEDFINIYEWHDEPGIEYPEHSHKGKVSLYITKGSVTFSGEINKTVNEGERFDVPVGAKHTAVVGTDGCDYIVAEEIEGDS